MYKKTIADAIYKKIRHRYYVEINEFYIGNLEEEKVYLIEKFIMNKGLYVRVDRLNSRLLKKYYLWKMKPVSIYVLDENDFDIHTMPAGKVIVTKASGIVTAKS